MSQLITDPNLETPDDLYQLLVELHAGLEEAESHKANARLILLLANHIGDRQVLKQAIAAARRLPPPGSATTPAIQDRP